MVPSITSNSIKHQTFIYTQLNYQTVLFLTFRFSISHLFAHSLNVEQFYLTHRYDPYQILPLWVRVDMRAMKLKGYSAFSKALRQEPHHQVSYPGHLLRWVSYPSAEMQSVYSTAPADWARFDLIVIEFFLSDSMSFASSLGTVQKLLALE